jgi:hypothetical protein
MLPLFPKQQTSLSAVGTSGLCQKQTSSSFILWGAVSDRVQGLAGVAAGHIGSGAPR